jgi:hypothetical protein
MSETLGRPSSRIALLLLAFGCQGNFNGTQGRVGPGADPGSGGSGSGGATSEGGAGGGGGGGQATGGTGPIAAGGSGASSCGAGALPVEIQSILGPKCQLCHGNPPLPTVPGSLMRTDDFARPAKSNPALTMAQSTMMRVTTTANLRMPPVPGTPLAAAEIQTLQAWIAAGSPPASCDPGSSGADGGTTSPPDAGPDPFAVPARCTSGTNWTGGTRESPLMQPGEACVACHAKGEAPRLAFGGTIYPSAHEPSQCNGASGTGSAQGAEVVLVDAAGMIFTAKVNAAGNFYVSARTPVTPPIRAKVVFMGRERVMIAAVPSGDCNGCHTQKGTTTLTTPGALPAPGRIILP